MRVFGAIVFLVVGSWLIGPSIDLLWDAKERNDAGTLKVLAKTHRNEVYSAIDRAGISCFNRHSKIKLPDFAGETTAAAVKAAFEIELMGGNSKLPNEELKRLKNARAAEISRASTGRFASLPREQGAEVLRILEFLTENSQEHFNCIVRVAMERLEQQNLIDRNKS